MLRMTWNDLKRYIDDALAADGRDGSIEIDYIDIRFPSLDHALYTPEVVISEWELIVHN